MSVGAAPGGALDQVVVGGPRGIGSVLPEAEHAGVDDAGVGRAHRLVVQTQPRHGLRPHVVHQHVGVHQQPLQRLPRPPAASGRARRALVAVGVRKIGPCRRGAPGRSAAPGRHAAIPP